MADKSRLEKANKLVETCLQVVVNHIVEVMEEKEHVFLSFDHLVNILSRQQFRQSYSPAVQATFVVDWLAADWPARFDTLSQLVEHGNKEDIVGGLLEAGIDTKGLLENCGVEDRPQKKMKMSESGHNTSDPIILVFESGSYDIMYYDIVNNRWK